MTKVQSQVLNGSLPFPHAYPLVFGTCCVGRIDHVGPDVAALHPEQLVFCDHIVYLRDATEKRIVLGEWIRVALLVIRPVGAVQT